MTGEYFIQGEIASVPHYTKSTNSAYTTFIFNNICHIMCPIRLNDLSTFHKWLKYFKNRIQSIKSLIDCAQLLQLRLNFLGLENAHRAIKTIKIKLFSAGF